MARPWLVVLLLVALLAAAALGEAPALDPATRVSVTTAGGEQRELSAAEFEQLARARHAAQAELQREPTEQRVERAELAALEKEDPELVRLVAAARAAFAALQTHGYARGYVLAGFSEVDGDRETRSLALAAARRGELRALLELRAARDHERSDANPGTGSFPRRSPPEQLHYHVDVLDDAQGRLSVVAAWELDAAGRRNVRLSIVKSAALLERELARRGALGGSAALALLAGGLLLVALGVLALYGSRKPAPRARAAPRKPSADLWELDEDQAPPAASGSAAAHKKTQ